MSTTYPRDDVKVIAVGNFRNEAGEFEHRLPPLSQTTRAQQHLAGLPTVRLSPAMRERLAQMAVTPAELEKASPEWFRIENGALHIIRLRVYTPLISLAVENDRLLADTRYAADPNAQVLTALAMPVPHESHAALVYRDAFEDLMESVDRAAERVKYHNPQDVGERIVELPLTVVPALFSGPRGQEVDDITAVDGNSRLIACFGCIYVEHGWVTGRNDHTRVPLQPSDLMRMPLKARRELVRKIVKAAYGTLRNPDSETEERRRAGMTLNALTAPVQVIVGYEDDDPSRGMQRFPAAVRSLLVRMNVGVKPFDDGAKHAVVAEEIVGALYGEGCFKEPGCSAEDFRDALIGRDREGMTQAMIGLGYDPSLPDQRFALVVEQLTRREPEVRAVFRDKLHKSRVYLKDRNTPIAELGLRSYSASRTDKQLKSIRRALNSGCLWKELVTDDWRAEPATQDRTIDGIRESADAGDKQARNYLGVLGMIALVTSGHLLAARGSAENEVGQPIDRSGVGLVIRSLLDMPEGRLLLTDAVKRTRKGLEPRWWDSERRQLVQQPARWRGATYDAHLRLAAHKGFGAEDAVRNPAAREEELFQRFEASLVNTSVHLDSLLDERDRNGTFDDLGWDKVEATMELLDAVKEDLQRISVPRPRRRS